MSQHYTFTLNNPTDQEKQYLSSLFEGQGVLYAVFGNEVAPTTGTPHLQGYVCFAEKRRLNVARTLLPRTHLEPARNPRAAIDYCKKENDFVEFGLIESVPFQGKRNDWEDFKNWVMTCPDYPSERDIAIKWTSLYGRYGRRCVQIRDLCRPQVPLEEGNYRGWQVSLAQRLTEPAHPRRIEFVVDQQGGCGKSWFIRKYLSTHDDAQMFSIGKRDDIAHAVDESKRVFFFNVPRESMQYLQYGILELIKDRLVFSPKYHSGTKRLIHVPHIVVFCNEEPDRNALTRDRFRILRIVNLV